MSIQSFLRDVKGAWRQVAGTQPPPPASNSNCIHMELAANSREVFTPQPLLEGRVYRLTFRGKYKFPSDCYGTRHADALYDPDYHGNLTVRHERLLLDGKPAAKDVESWQESRAHNRHSYELEGTGQELSLCLISQHGSSGRLDVHITSSHHLHNAPD